MSQTGRDYKVIPRGLLPRSEADEQGHVWYLAFGSNMNDKVFKGRRYAILLQNLLHKSPSLQLKQQQTYIYMVFQLFQKYAIF